METTVEDRHLEVDDRVTCQVTFAETIAHSFFDRRDKLPGDNTADDVVDEFKSAPTRQRFDLQPTITILAAAAGLALILALGLGATLDGFLVRNFGRGQLDVDVELTLELF